MRSDMWQSWQDAFDAEWKDEVDAPGADGQGCPDFDDLLDDAKDLARTVVEPLKVIAQSMPDVFVAEYKHWRRARRRWARSRSFTW